MDVWDDLKQRLVVEFLSGAKLWTSSPEDIDRYEAESGFRLPDSYRELVGTFGPGTYGRGWRLAAPGVPNSSSDNLAKLNEYLRPVHPGFVFFCGKEDFHAHFAWDSGDITDPATHEYGVYLVGSPGSGDSFEAQTTKVASTFREFLMTYALGGGFERHGAAYGYGLPAEVLDDPVVGFFQVV
jgi:hypothetical protein